MSRRKKDIGKFRQRVTIYEATRVDDGSGGFDRQDPSDATKVGTFWADLKPVSAKERTWGGQFTEQTTHKCWLRKNAAAVPGAIVREGTTDYYIESAYDPDNLGEFMMLTLREGGPL